MLFFFSTSGTSTPKVSGLKAEFSLLTKVGDKTVDRNTVNQDPVTNTTGENVSVSRSAAFRKFLTKK